MGWVELLVDENELDWFYMGEAIKEDEYLQKVGSFPHDLIRDAIGEHEWKIDKPGFYEFWALCILCSTSDPDSESYLKIQHIETEYLKSLQKSDE